MMMPDQGQGQSPQLAALMQQLQPPQDQGTDGSYGGGDPLQALQQCIQDVHGLAATLPNAQHTQMAIQALGILTKIQSDLMAEKNGGGAQ
jgi:hypothetical protein